MSTCLSDARVQAAADGESTAAEDAHAGTCPRCRDRVDAAHQALRAFGAAMKGDVPPSLEHRVARAVQQAGALPRRGATALVPHGAASWRRPAWLSAAAAVAVAVVIAVVVMPSVDDSSRLSAAAIIDRSIATLAPSATELLEYELTVTTPPGWTVESGAYRIEQQIEHDGSGRWRLARFDESGLLLNGMSEDPEARRRRAFLRVDGQAYVFDFETGVDAQVRLGEVQRQYAEAAMRVIQASGRVVITEEQTTGKRFIIELPDSASRPQQGGPALMWDLTGARLVVDGGDYHVLELSANGVYMGKPVSVSYRLMRRELRASSQVAPSEFELPIEPGAIELRGRGSLHPPRDIVTILLDEMRRLRR